MLFTLTFSIQSPETGEYVPLLDPAGNEVTMRVEAASKTAAINYDAYVENFCRDKGDDCRVRGIT